jgi:predicted amidophosphoribosyltransferase
METEDTLKKIKVYCFEHQTTCEAKAKPQIVCTIEEHTLSNDFPYADFWEYCCDCQTFLPTKPDIVGKVSSSCPNCDRSAARRFVCGHCKIAAFDSDEPARGKTYNLSGTAGIKPNCPGCQTISQKDAAILHNCKHIKSEFFTSRPTCPFCLEDTILAVSEPEPTATKVVLGNAAQCPQCQAWNLPTSAFCGKCKHQLLSSVAVSNLGTDINKTQLLGSLCPNCSTPVPPDSDFCGECGQAVKKAIPPPPPPPPPKITGEPSIINLPDSSPTNSASNTAVRNVAIGVGGFFLFIIILAVVSNTSKSSSSSAYNSNTNSAIVVNNNSRMSNSRSVNTLSPTKTAVSSTPNKSNSDSRIGKTGTLNIDSNLRETAGKDSNWVGTHYRGARIKILDVEIVTNANGSTTDWFKIEVISYGNSMDPNKYGDSGKDAGSEDVGWVNSYPEVYEDSRKKRVILISLD